MDNVVYFEQRSVKENKHEYDKAYLHFRKGIATKELADRIVHIEGIQWTYLEFDHLGLDTYSIWIQKARAYTWKEIMPRLKEVLKNKIIVFEKEE